MPGSFNKLNYHTDNILVKFCSNSRNILNHSKLRGFLRICKSNLYELLFKSETESYHSIPITKIIHNSKGINDNTTLTVIGVIFEFVDANLICTAKIKNKYLLEHIVNELNLFVDDFLDKENNAKAKEVFLTIIKNTGKETALNIFYNTRICSYKHYIDEAFIEKNDQQFKTQKIFSIITFLTMNQAQKK